MGASPSPASWTLGLASRPERVGPLGEVTARRDFGLLRPVLTVSCSTRFVTLRRIRVTLRDRRGGGG